MRVGSGVILFQLAGFLTSALADFYFAKHTMPEHRDELDKEFLDSLMPWTPEVNKICQSENRREQ